MMHDVYLPFSKEQLLSHFAGVKKNRVCIKNEKHLGDYEKSIERYTKYLAKKPSRSGRPLKEMQDPCQIEKDERFWIAACMMTVFYSQNRTEELSALSKDAYGAKPPVQVDSWEECFNGELHLFFETGLPSPKSYKKWLRENFDKRHFIPYVKYCVDGKSNLEGATFVDAILLNSENGFAILIEAKVLSDISCQITYDVMRNQIARNIDVMLEKNTLCSPLDRRDPEKTLFLLVTPQLFKNNPESRLYGYKFNEYKRNPHSLAKDLPHRKKMDWQKLSSRIGWLTWENFKDVNPKCCKWLAKA